MSNHADSNKQQGEALVREWANFHPDVPLTRTYTDLAQRIDKALRSHASVAAPGVKAHYEKAHDARYVMAHAVHPDIVVLWFLALKARWFDDPSNLFYGQREQAKIYLYKWVETGELADDRTTLEIATAMKFREWLGSSWTTAAASSPSPASPVQPPSTDDALNTIWAEEGGFRLLLRTSDPLQPEGEHPEDFCKKCGRPNIVWFGPNRIWNQAVRAANEPEILCPVCFVQLAEAAGFKDVWEVAPQGWHAEETKHSVAQAFAVIDKAIDAATPPDTPAPLTPDSEAPDLLWVNPVAGAVASHRAGSAFLPYRRVVDTPVVAAAKDAAQEIAAIYGLGHQRGAIASIITRHFAATTSPSETAVGGEAQNGIALVDREEAAIKAEGAYANATHLGRKGESDMYEYACHVAAGIIRSMKPYALAPVAAAGDDEGEPRTTVQVERERIRSGVERLRPFGSGDDCTCERCQTLNAVLILIDNKPTKETGI